MRRPGSDPELQHRVANDTDILSLLADDSDVVFCLREGVTAEAHLARAAVPARPHANVWPSRRPCDRERWSVTQVAMPRQPTPRLAGWRVRHGGSTLEAWAPHLTLVLHKRRLRPIFGALPRPAWERGTGFWRLEAAGAPPPH